MRFDYLEDDDGNLCKVLVSDHRFENMYLSSTGREKPLAYCLVVTPEIEAAFREHFNSAQAQEVGSE